MKTMHVMRIYEVNLPDDRTAINAAVDEDHEHPEDAAIVKASDEALAVYLSYKSDAGEFQDVADVLDIRVTDKIPDIEEFELETEE